ncbi:TonB-dependent receptor domain-containing protein [Novosphingobium tardum]|uniref:TonB-dependent receptor domain-containing protein n=1 Tax=Novosphingobium tardum TaxID=1538021 RepID=A0ABV8RMD9_9SPHN
MALSIKPALRGTTSLYSAALVAFAAVGGSSAAYAQAAPADETAAVDTANCVDANGNAVCDDQEGSTIVVTGSRIRQPNLESANPVAVVTGAQVFETGNISVGDLLNELPQLRSTFSQQNGTRFLGTRGLNLLDLRGLGTQRTLVLVNGRRHVGSDVLSNGVSVDTNTIPSDLIERIDVVTGGASAVYGSDAIAGVVNFILKDDFEGIQLRGQAGVSKYKDAGNQFVSMTAGTNFGSDDRGNIALNVEYAHSQDFYAPGRPSLRYNRNFVVVDTDPGGSVNGSDGVPDRAFYNDIRFASLALGGSVLAFPNPTTAPCGFNVAAYACSFLFQPDGTLVPQTGTRIGLGPTGNFLGGNGLTNREGKLLALSPDLQRYSANLIAHYEISPAFVPFLEAKYVRSEAFGSQSGPFFSQGATLGDPGGRERVRLDNPYLSSQARSLLTQQFLATTVNPNTGAALSAASLAAQQAAVTAGTFRFSLRRNWTDFGIRDEDITRETYRGVIGVRGDFNDDWNYEVFANYGEHKEKNIIAGNVNIQRYLLGLDTTRDANGNIVCRSQLNPAGTISYLTGSPLSAGDDPKLAADIAACVPINPFGVGSVTDAARKYVLVDSRASGKITQLNFGGFVTGDTSGFFNLPGGPVGFSVGAEYRKETLRYDLDDLTQAGYAFYNAIPSFTSPSFSVKEAYAEIQIPLLKDTPFFEELTLRGNGRVSDYKGATGTTYAYGGEVTWKPINDVTLRGTYARSVRAPNLSEIYSPAGQNFAPGFADPCSARNLATGSATRVANCNAAGRPAGYDFVYSSSLEISSGGNPNLTEETSDSYTGGILLQPRFIPGLSLSADYYDITVNDVISAVSAQQIANLCYDSPDLNNPFCGLFTRNTAATGPAGEIPFQILEGSLLQSSANFAKLKVRGIDSQLDYRYVEGDWTVNLNALWTHVLQNDAFTNPQNPAFKNRIINELGDPQDQVNLNASVKYKKFTAGYQIRWIGKQYLNTYEDFNPLNGLPPQNADYAAVKKYPDTAYMDVRVALDVTDQFNIYFGVDNVANRMPPYGLTGVGGGSGIFDNRGRYFYTGVKANF